MSRPHAHLDLEGDLSLEIGGERVAIRAAGAVAAVEVSGFAGGRRVFSSLPERRSRRTALRRLDQLLRHTGLTVAVRIAESEVGHLGTGARPGWVSRALALDPLALRIAPLWRAWRGARRRVDDAA